MNDHQRNSSNNKSSSRSHNPNSSDRYSKQTSHRSVNFNENEKNPNANTDQNDQDAFANANSIYKSSQQDNAKIYDINKDKTDSGNAKNQGS